MNSAAAVDICVVGAGAAGMALALRLADHGQAVTLIDAGGPTADASAEDLQRGDVVSGLDATDRRDHTLVGGTLYSADHLMRTRWRHPGGSGWLWGVRGRHGGKPSVRMVEGAPADFGPRPQFDIPGFPLDPADVLRHRDDALTYLGLEGHSFDPARYADIERPNLDLTSHHLSDKIFHFPKAEVIRKVRPADVASHPCIDFRTGMHLVGMERTSNRISALHFTDDTRASFTVNPNRVVLALGGIENSRHLLMGADEGTIPNPHDLLGRWFMDHPHIRLGYLPEADIAALGHYDFQEVEGTYVLRGHGIDPDFADAAGHLRFSIDFVGRHAHDGSSTGYALATARDSIRRRELKDVATHLARAATHPKRALTLAQAARKDLVFHTGLGGWSEPDPAMPVGTLSVEAMFEQRPSPDNRVRLGRRTDRYGRPLPTLQWSWSRAEVEAVHRAVDWTGHALADAGLGSMTTLRALGEGPIPRAGSGLHHIGGTRMSHDPTEGVVDADARLHQLDNLYVAGSSVFPTSVGFANPTFTIIQMAMRLADHLAER